MMFSIHLWAYLTSLMTSLSTENDQGQALVVLRVLRVIRVLKLARSEPFIGRLEYVVMS